MTCWSHITLAKKEGPEVLRDNRKRDRKDVEVVQRLRMLQASCMTIVHECPFIESASENKKRIELILKLQS